jgi:hypothetical protein
VKEYVGFGRIGEAAAKEDAERRAARTALRQAEQRRRQAFEAAQAQITTVCDEAGSILKEALQAAGYHQHARGYWRKRRGKT